MEIVNKKVDELIPYENNPRKNDEAVDYVAKSISEFGFKVPIVIDKGNVVVAGHTRLKAAKQLEIQEVPCIVADDLNEEQIKAFRLADNKVSEKAKWNDTLLDKELQEILNIDMGEFGFDSNIKEEIENPYTAKINIPQYEITGDEPEISDLVNDYKTTQLMEEIENSNVTPEQKNFLRMAATRHLEFNYRNVAEYYAHQDKEMQELMEKSALVIIDFGDAIANGFVQLSKEIDDIVEED